MKDLAENRNPPRQLLWGKRPGGAWHKVAYRVYVRRDVANCYPSEEYDVRIQEGILYVARNDIVVLILNKGEWRKVDLVVQVHDMWLDVVDVEWRQEEPKES